MILKPPLSITDFKKVRATILDLMKNPWIELSDWRNLKIKLNKVEEKINTLNTTT